MTEAAVAEGNPPLEILEQGLLAGMRRVGEDFRVSKLFVPQVLLAARAMKAGMAVLRPLLAETEGGPTPRVLVLGTVKGDLHDIGKNLVAMLAEGAGFTVVDLGTNTPAADFVSAAREHDAAIIGLSALLTTTMVSMKAVVAAVREAGLQAQICVGGAPVNQAWCDDIGADGYAADAAAAVELFERLVPQAG